jgi:hypothetical protein
MNRENLSNYHYSYMSMIRHWHPESEKYTGGDALFTAFDNGWDMDDEVQYENFWHAGTRGVTVYHFTLRRGDERMSMPVITNPYVRRLLKESEAKVVAKENKKGARAV